MKEMTFLLWPPVAFCIVFLAMLGLSFLCSRASLRPGPHVKGGEEAYACGEPQYNHTARPDYSVFFPFAFFFTIAHVATMIMTAVPVETPPVFFLAFLYITGVLTGLYILMRD